MRIRVLGALEVEREGSPVAVGGPKQRTVLALLVQDVGYRVSIDRLIHGVYGDEAAGGARRTVQTYVSNLRQGLGDAIQRTSDGYLLAIDPTTVDAGAFEAAYTTAAEEFEHEPQRAADRLLDALALWRGHPYADLKAHGLLDAEIARLQELRLAALERRIECDLALGRERELVGELEALTVEHPLRESFRSQQAVALYRTGRQSDALAVIEQTGDVLAEELGLDLSPRLQRLQRRILRQDPTLEREVGPRVERRALLVAELDAERWSAARRAATLAQRDDLLTGIVEAGHATIVGLRATAAFVAFTDAAAAVEAAVELAGMDPDPTLRVAVDHGDVEVRGDTATGPPVNRAARIVALAHPGQVLLSAEAHQALMGADAVGWSATALGPHDVVGIEKPLALYQIHGDALPVRFPPLRTGGLPPPVPRTTLASVPGYELRTRLGSGDIGSVYRAYQASVGREVVVRAIPRQLAADPAFVRRFEAEGQRVARLAHPHVLPLLDYWRDPDGAYLVHPLVTGGELRQRMGGRRTGPDEALDVLERIEAALTHAHAHGVVHGRLHPGNVLVDESGHPYVTDFGLAQMCEGLIGSSAHAFVDPATLGGGPLDVAADVYALGVLAFELFEGRLPPQDRALPLPATVLGDTLSRATSTDPADRPESASALLTELRSAITGGASATPRRSVVRNPYRGLEPFQEADASDFHGREALIDELVRAIADHRLVTVVGPSGIGKSSVVSAGLVPALRGGAIDGADRWLVTDLSPGARPFEELAVALRRVAVHPFPEAERELRSSEDGLLRCVDRMLPSDSELLLVVDQFEEVFTQTRDEEVRRAFLAVLGAAAAPRSRVRVVVTLRADFFDRPLRYAAFAEVMRRGVVAVRVPSREELLRAVRAPALGVGVTVEDQLAERLVGEADGQPGALPLLQHVLTERFASRSSDVMTLADYEETGGLRGAVGRKAEELFLELTTEQRATARLLFLQLVTVDEEDEDTRRRVRKSELSTSGVDATDLERVLELFGGARLLTFDRDPATRGPSVEVAHESLLSEWERLRRWIDEVRDDLLIRRRLSASVREWQDADRDPALLLRGARLETAEQWRRAQRLPPSAEEDTYLAISRRAVDTEVARQRRRRRSVIGALAAALVVTLTFSFVAMVQRGVADEQLQLTRARELAGEAISAVEADPERGMLLALEAIDTHRDDSGRPVPESTSALHTALQQSRVRHHVTGGVEAVAFSPDGRTVATDVDEPGEVRLFDAATGEELTRVVGHGAIGDVAFSPDGTLLAVGYLDAADEPAVETFEVGSWSARTAYPGPSSGIRQLRFTDDGGRHLVGLGVDDEVTAWEVGSGDVTAPIGPGLAFDTVPGSSIVALTRGDEEVVYVDARDGRSVDTLPTPGIVGEDIAVDDHHVVVNSFPGRTVEVWDRATHARLARFSNPSPLRLGLAPDDRVVHTANDGTIRLADVAVDAEELVLRGHSDGITGLAFAPSGDELATVSWAGETRVWDVTPDGPADLGAVSVPEGFVWETVSPAEQDRMWVTVSLPGNAQRIDVVDLATRTRSVAVDGLWGRPHHYAVLAGDGGAVASFDQELRAHVYDLPSGEPRFELAPCQTPRALSDDATLLVVDGQLLCTSIDGQPGPMEPPPDAELRSAVLDARTGQRLLDLGERPLNSAALGPTGTPAAGYAALSVDWTTIELHDLETGALVGSLDIEPDFSTSIWFSDDGNHLSFGTQSGLVTVVDVAAIGSGASMSDAVVWAFREPAGGVVTHTRIGGGRLATASMSGHVRVYDLDDRRLIADLEVEALDPGSLSFVADATALRYEDGRTVRRLELDTDRMIALARAHLTRGLTAEECEQYRLASPACDETPTRP